MKNFYLRNLILKVLWQIVEMLQALKVLLDSSSTYNSSTLCQQELGEAKILEHQANPKVNFDVDGYKKLL